MEIHDIDGILIVTADPLGKGGPGSGRYPSGSSGNTSSGGGSSSGGKKEWKEDKNGDSVIENDTTTATVTLADTGDPKEPERYVVRYNSKTEDRRKWAGEEFEATEKGKADAKTYAEANLDTIKWPKPTRQKPLRGPGIDYPIYD